MKKLFLFLFLLQTKLLFSQIVVNQDSVNFYFQQVLNDYRLKNNLTPLVVDATYKPFVDSWSTYMMSHNYCGHGVGVYSFDNRVNTFEPLKNKIIANVSPTENVAGPWDFNSTLPSDPDDVNYSYYTKVSNGVSYKYKLTTNEIQNLVVVENEISDNINVNKNIALFIFYLWKNSPSHNEAMLSPYVHGFYVSVKFIGTKVTASYLASV